MIDIFGLERVAAVVAVGGALIGIRDLLSDGRLVKDGVGAGCRVCTSCSAEAFCRDLNSFNCCLLFFFFFLLVGPFCFFTGCLS